jgi:pyruvate, water dikinase
VSAASAQGECRPLDQLRSADEPRFGGKSSALGELIAAGIRVPPGFALAREAYERSRQLGGRVPEEVRSAIDRSYTALAEVAAVEDPPVAVRSSAVGEDSATATFAGQQETVLWVRGIDAICTAVESCWDSLYSETATTYREHMGDGRTPAMGVTIQLMVDSLISGVLFTCNPLSGDPSMVAINASWGLGLSVVGGEVTPDDYLVSKVTGEIVRETVGDKRVEYVPDPDNPGVLLRDVDDERAQVRCLDEHSISALVDVAKAAQQHFGSHQDVEWAIARTGSVPDNVYVVQSRPVTTIQPKAPEAAPMSAISLVMAQFGAPPRKQA